MRRRVLVVEDQAHFAFGHYPQGFASLARALTRLGCDVRVLTSRGWVGGDGRGDGFRVERFGPITAGLWAVARLLGPSMSRTAWPRRVRWSAYGAATLRAMSIALATRHAVRRSGDAPPDVILFHHDVHALVVAGLVGPGRFLHHAFRAPADDRPRTAAGRVVERMARRCERARRRAGGGFRIAAATPALVDAWTRRAPYLEPVLVVHGMSRDEATIHGARDALGIPDDARVALVFGSDHGSKDLDTVWCAFRELPEWTLLVVGHVGDRYQRWATEHGALHSAVAIGGYVDERTRAGAYTAADVVVLSYRDAHVRDSGVLQDALAFSRPVVCSDGNDSADRVREFGLGCVFEPGNAGALAAAVRAAPRSLTADAVSRARELTSDDAVARAHLDALAAIGTSDQTGRK